MMDEPVIDRPEIKPTEDQRVELAKKLRRMSEEAIEYKGNWEEVSALNWRQYLCIPDQEVKEYPWHDASNFFAPLTRVTVDTLASQYYDAMFSTKPRVIGIGVEDDPVAQALNSYYFDYFWYNEQKLPFIGNDWNLQTIIDGTAVVQNRWNKDYSVRRYDDVRVEPVYSKGTTTILGSEVESRLPVDIKVKAEEKVEAYTEERAMVDIVDLNDIFWAPGSGPSLQWPECPWFFHRVWWTKADLLARQREGFWLGDSDREDLSAMMQEREVSSAQRLKLDQAEATEKTEEALEVHVFYMRLVLPGTVYLPNGEKHEQRFDDDDGYSEEVVVWTIPHTKEDALKVVMIKPLARIRPDRKRPFVDNRYMRVPNHPYGLGIPYKLRNVNRLVNSSINQMMDYGSLQNTPFGFYEPQVTGILPEMHEIRPGAMIPVQRAGGVNFPRMQGDKSFWQSVLQMGMMWAEKDTAVTDFTQGRSSSMPNAPRTFRGMAMLMQKASEFFSYMVQLQAESYLELFRQVHALHRKHFPEEREIRFFNRQNGVFQTLRMSSSLFQDDVDFSFQLNPNRSSDQQQALMMFQMFAPILMQQGNLQGVRQMAREVWEAHGKKNFDQIWPEMPPAMAGQGPTGPPGMPPGPAMPQGLNTNLNPLGPAPNPM